MWLLWSLVGCPKPVEVAEVPLDVNVPCSAEGANSALQPFIGAWQPEDSSAIFRFCMSGGELKVDGWDSMNDERFQISAVAFDGTELRFDSFMPSTNFKVQNTLAFVDGVLIDVRNGEDEGARMERKGGE